MTPFERAWSAHDWVMDETLTIPNEATLSGPSYREEARVTEPGSATGRVKLREIEFDTSGGASETLPGPAELLALSLGACLLKNVERLSLLPFHYDGCSVSVVAERQESPPRFTKIRYELRIRTDVLPHRVELLHRQPSGGPARCTTRSLLPATSTAR